MTSHPKDQPASHGVLGEPRGRLLSELCGRPQTATELADKVGTSPNAVRVHLDALRLAGLVSFTIERRGVGKPTHVYSLTEAAEYLLSTAYAPALRAILLTLRGQLGHGLDAWLHNAGRTLASDQPEHTDPRGGIDAALRFLGALGAGVSADRDEQAYVVHLTCCPLGAASRTLPETCKFLEGALSAMLPSHSVLEQCDRGQHPRCAFRIEDALKQDRPVS
jgi:Predicted transcriptional regulator